jgi:hypothetical protein
LELFANQVTDLARVEFQLGYDNSVIGFDNSSSGPFLAGGGSITSGNNRINGDVAVPAGSPGNNGSGRILLLAWAYRGPRTQVSLPLTGRAFDSTGAEITDMSLFGGSVNIQ